MNSNRASTTGFEDASQLLRLIADAVDAEIHVKDTKGIYRFVNRAFCRDFDFDPDDVLGRDDLAIFPPDVARTIRESDRRIVESGIAETVEEGGELRGRHVTYRTNKVPLRTPGGRVFAICGIGLDVSAERERERELRGLLERLQSLHDEVKVLRGIVPLCCFCKRVRDAAGEWQPVEVYIRRNSEADVSHGICPNCEREHYREVCEE